MSLLAVGARVLGLRGLRPVTSTRLFTSSAPSLFETESQHHTDALSDEMPMDVHTHTPSPSTPVSHAAQRNDMDEEASIRRNDFLRNLASGKERAAEEKSPFVFVSANSPLTRKEVIAFLGEHGATVKSIKPAVAPKFVSNAFVVEMEDESSIDAHIPDSSVITGLSLTRMNRCTKDYAERRTTHALVDVPETTAIIHGMDMETHPRDIERWFDGYRLKMGSVTIVTNVQQHQPGKPKAALAALVRFEDEDTLHRALRMKNRSFFGNRVVTMTPLTL